MQTTQDINIDRFKNIFLKNIHKSLYNGIMHNQRYFTSIENTGEYYIKLFGLFKITYSVDSFYKYRYDPSSHMYDVTVNSELHDFCESDIRYIVDNIVDDIFEFHMIYLGIFSRGYKKKQNIGNKGLRKLILDALFLRKYEMSNDMEYIRSLLIQLYVDITINSTNNYKQNNMLSNLQQTYKNKYDKNNSNTSLLFNDILINKIQQWLDEYNVSKFINRDNILSFNKYRQSFVIY